MMPTADDLPEYALRLAQQTKDLERQQALLDELEALAAGAIPGGAFGFPAGLPPAAYRAARQRVEECWGGSPNDQ